MSDAELAQEIVREFLHLGRSLDVELYDQEIKRAKAIIARVRLEEAKAIPDLSNRWAHGFSEQHILNGDCPGCYKIKRISVLEAAAKGGGSYG